VNDALMYPKTVIDSIPERISVFEQIGGVNNSMTQLFNALSF